MSRTAHGDQKKPSNGRLGEIHPDQPASGASTAHSGLPRDEIEHPVHASASELAARAAHDLGNYLQVVRSALNLIDRQMIPSSRQPTRSLLGGAQDALSRASILCGTLRTCGDVAQTEKMVTTFADVLRELAAMIALVAGPTIKIRLVCPEDGPAALCNRRGLEDCIVNLVT